MQYVSEEVRQRRRAVKKVDSAGMTEEQVENFEKNALRPPRLSDDAREIANLVAYEQNEYPKIMYRLALKAGKPAGDEAAPSYPLPYDLAAQCGLTELGFPVLNRTVNSPGYLKVLLPYITRSVGAPGADGIAIDQGKAREEERKLRAEGWVSDPNLIPGLPKKTVEFQDYDPLPNLPGQQAEANVAQRFGVPAETLALELLKDGSKSLRQIGEATGLSKSAVHRLKAKLANGNGGTEGSNNGKEA